MQIYDTLSKSKKELTPRTNNKIGIFVCGPTVYDYSHIGHARTYVAFDSFVKYLEFKGYNVRYIQNITDVDDKIIQRARELNQNPRDLSINFETEYFRDMESLGVDSVDKYARATDYIPQIISQVSRLMEKGFSYVTNDGIYYDISKFKDYGKLSGRTVKQAEDAVSRIDESIHKRNKGDFALWKFSKPDEPRADSAKSFVEPRWESPWGDGRPGWHIEDTAITEEELGQQYDIHGGARDLIFPHHESEIAQMEAISEKAPLVNYWMHTGFLTVNGEKMSKSLGNFITIHELLKKYPKEVFRLFVLSSHYRSPVDYQESALLQSKANIESIKEFYYKINELSGEKSYDTPKNQFANVYRDKFYAELDDDFNTPKALSVLFELVRACNGLISNSKLKPADAYSVFHLLAGINSVFGIIPLEKSQQIPEEVTKLLNQRETLRKQEKWDEADKIRSQVERMGYEIKDTNSGFEIKPVQ